MRLKHALTKLVQTVRATGAHLVAFNKGNMQVQLSAITGFPLLGEIDYNERYAKLDPRAPVYLGAPVGEWLSCHHYFNDDFVESSEFYQDFLIPYGGRYISGVKLLENATHAVLLGVHSGIDRQPLASDALDFLRRVTPHLERALRLIFQYAELQNQWAVTKATLDMLDYGAFICDQTADVLVANETALAIAEQRDGIEIRSGRVILTETKAHARLRSTLLRTPDGLSDRADVGALLVNRRSELPAFQLIARRLDPQRSLLGMSERSLWSVMISDPARASVPTMRAVAVMYGLTPAEAKLAAHLAAGMTLDEIAEHSHVKRSTVKSQLGSLFAKTGTRRQAELVRLFSTAPSLRDVAA
jgi:DNA-binding CsgD family transcriptional regulator